MNTYTRNGIDIELVQGDIASQDDIEAVVNAANAQLRTGGGVAGAIHRGAGPGLTEETRQYAPIEPGEAVVTGGHNLPNAFVIHCLGPRWEIDTPEEELLRRCYRRALELAEENEIASVAFPALSTGAFGYPIQEATEVAVDEVLGELDRLESVERIRFVVFSDGDREVYEEVLADRLG
jgi:O-acetyl-ADP-ribose deacetylase (regulator of RNase III)